MDASAYIEGDKWERMKSSNGWNDVEVRDNRYNQIVHMVSAANGAEKFYSTEVNQLSCHVSHLHYIVNVFFIFRIIRAAQKVLTMLEN